MIKVVVDTGIIVSAAFRDRVPEEIILFITVQDEFEWIVSPAILEEYNEVLTREKFGLTPEILRKWGDIFEQCTTLIDTDRKIDFPRDQKDAKFLEHALTANAHYLITGDKDFEEAQKLVDTTIISVSRFKQLVMEKWI